MAVAVPTRPPLWRNVRVLRVVGQIVFVLLVIFVFREMYLNITYNLDVRDQSFSYGFLDNRSGFGIKEHIVSYRATMPFYRAFLVAYTNALGLALLGILGATVLGLIVGVARLSPNWLVRRISQAYVEFFRNIPLLVQVIFWWAAVFLTIPRIENSISIFGIAYLSNRGMGVPIVRGGDGFAPWWGFVLLGLILAAIVFRWRTKLNEATGTPAYRYLLGAGVWIAVATIGYFVVSDPFTVETPEVGAHNLVGGFQMSPEFAGIFVALVVYTAAFIGEITRGSILSVSKGQKEAASALGLQAGQQLRFVVLPQAMRIAIPSITNQYLNLWKNTSLAFAIGFPELINISTTMINQTGSELQIYTLVVAAYLLTSLALSAVMNVVNRAVAFKGERR
jgi:general L-amino acid transport system permease protein